MNAREPFQVWLNAVNASVADQSSTHFSIGEIDRVIYEIEGTGPVVEVQHNQKWDTSTNAPASANWYTIETQSAAGIYALDVASGWMRFKATDGNPVTVRARRLEASPVPLNC